MKKPAHVTVTDDDAFAFMQTTSGKPVVFVNINWLITNTPSHNIAGQNLILFMDRLKERALSILARTATWRF